MILMLFPVVCLLTFPIYGTNITGETERLSFNSKTLKELILYITQVSAVVPASKSDLSFDSKR